MLNEYKVAFKEDMTLMYPDAIGLHQLRDVWRVWFMGCIAGLLKSGQAQSAADLMLEAKSLQMDDCNWWPDESFNWWV